MILLRFFILFTLLGIGGMAGAGTEENDRLNRLLAENTSTIKANEDPYGETFINRRLVRYVQLGKTYGLPDKDVETIKNAGKPTGIIKAMEPMMMQLREKASVEDGSPIEMAQIWHDAVRAERAAITQFYNELIGRLSEEGQNLLAAERAREMTSASFSETDFVTLATQDPDGVRVLMTLASDAYKQSTEKSVEEIPGEDDPRIDGGPGLVYDTKASKGEDDVSD